MSRTIGGSETHGERDDRPSASFRISTTDPRPGDVGGASCSDNSCSMLESGRSEIAPSGALHCHGEGNGQQRRAMVNILDDIESRELSRRRANSLIQQEEIYKEFALLGIRKASPTEANVFKESPNATAAARSKGNQEQNAVFDARGKAKGKGKASASATDLSGFQPPQQADGRRWNLSCLGPCWNPAAGPSVVGKSDNSNWDNLVAGDEEQVRKQAKFLSGQGAGILVNSHRPARQCCQTLQNPYRSEPLERQPRVRSRVPKVESKFSDERVAAVSNDRLVGNQTQRDLRSHLSCAYRTSPKNVQNRAYPSSEASHGEEVQMRGTLKLVASRESSKISEMGDENLPTSVPNYGVRHPRKFHAEEQENVQAVNSRQSKQTSHDISQLPIESTRVADGAAEAAHLPETAGVKSRNHASSLMTIVHGAQMQDTQKPNAEDSQLPNTDHENIENLVQDLTSALGNLLSTQQQRKGAAALANILNIVGNMRMNSEMSPHQDGFQPTVGPSSNSSLEAASVRKTHARGKTLDGMPTAQDDDYASGKFRSTTGSRKLASHPASGSVMQQEEPRLQKSRGLREILEPMPTSCAGDTSRGNNFNDIASRNNISSDPSLPVTNANAKQNEPQMQTRTRDRGKILNETPAAHFDRACGKGMDFKPLNLDSNSAPSRRRTVALSENLDALPATLDSNPPRSKFNHRSASHPFICPIPDPPRLRKSHVVSAFPKLQSAGDSVDKKSNRQDEFTSEARNSPASQGLNTSNESPPEPYSQTPMDVVEHSQQRGKRSKGLQASKRKDSKSTHPSSEKFGGSRQSSQMLEAMIGVIEFLDDLRSYSQMLDTIVEEQIISPSFGSSGAILKSGLGERDPPAEASQDRDNSSDMRQRSRRPRTQGNEFQDEAGKMTYDTLNASSRQGRQMVDTTVPSQVVSKDEGALSNQTIDDEMALTTRGQNENRSQDLNKNPPTLTQHHDSDEASQPPTEFGFREDFGENYLNSVSEQVLDELSTGPSVDVMEQRKQLQNQSFGGASTSRRNRFLQLSQHGKDGSTSKASINLQDKTVREFTNDLYENNGSQTEPANETERVPGQSNGYSQHRDPRFREDTPLNFLNFPSDQFQEFRDPGSSQTMPDGGGGRLDFEPRFRENSAFDFLNSLREEIAQGKYRETAYESKRDIEFDTRNGKLTSIPQPTSPISERQESSGHENSQQGFLPNSLDHDSQVSTESVKLHKTRTRRSIGAKGPKEEPSCRKIPRPHQRTASRSREDPDTTSSSAAALEHGSRRPRKSTSHIHLLNEMLQDLEATVSKSHKNL